MVSGFTVITGISVSTKIQMRVVITCDTRWQRLPQEKIFYEKLLLIQLYGIVNFSVNFHTKHQKVLFVIYTCGFDCHLYSRWPSTGRHPSVETISNSDLIYGYNFNFSVWNFIPTGYYPVLKVNSWTVATHTSGTLSKQKIFGFDIHVLVSAFKAQIVIWNYNWIYHYINIEYKQYIR